MPANDPILTSELIKIMKIFGLVSVGIVLILSFFNDYRADNSASKGPNHITDSNLLYFKNVRKPYYDIDKNKESKLEIYRLRKRFKNKNLIFVNPSIIISRIRNKAYIFIEPSERLENEAQVEVRWIVDKEIRDTVSFRQGDRRSHYRFVKKIWPLIDGKTKFQVKVAQEWLPILDTEEGQEAFLTTAEDYFRLIE
ncbi:hypothetical protein DN752_11120 [Echinicola strongylocentroti]|uniref:Uncharacterized protein n=1 Tax=Echinicola strongylocentroti TaxID=1795355 RepID=A0A2Z4IIW1_9BACT|nr:hypothetical protein [Echinicola strongylocentroti]AWW30630.1 hypothetical protein DN752_11120 [Echinicola strongylocentroti]